MLYVSKYNNIIYHNNSRLTRSWLILTLLWKILLITIFLWGHVPRGETLTTKPRYFALHYWLVFIQTDIITILIYFVRDENTWPVMWKIIGLLALQQSLGGLILSFLWFIDSDQEQNAMFHITRHIICTIFWTQNTT